MAKLAGGAPAAAYVGVAGGTEETKGKRAQIREDFTSHTMKSFTRFSEYDADGSQTLDWEEFYAMQPKRVRDTHTAADIRKASAQRSCGLLLKARVVSPLQPHFDSLALQWFEAADTDGDGSLSINEFFVWSLTHAATKHGAVTLQSIFERYDKDGSGLLEKAEFDRAAAEMGFGAVSATLFKGMASNSGGGIPYRELTARLKRDVPQDIETKKMLSALMWTWDRGVEAEAKLDVS